jgi:polysaccharide biosynthesis protein VpsQ
MYNLIKCLASAFFIFILWVIYSANTGKQNIFFDLVNATPYGDKVGHFFLFGILTLFANIATIFKTYKITNFKIYLGTTLVIAFVILEELSQAFISTRTFEITDLISDFSGISMFTYCSFVANFYFKQTSP